jgi:hypothetical protein
MSRTPHPDHYGLHQVTSGPRRPYGTCPRCRRTKPMYWISKTHYLCSQCMRATGKRPYVPSLAPTPPTLPPALAWLESEQPGKQRPKKSGKAAFKRASAKSPTPPSREQISQVKKSAEPAHSPLPLQHERPQRSASPGATPETLARWQRNREAVERARERLLETQRPSSKRS